MCEKPAFFAPLATPMRGICSFHTKYHKNSWNKKHKDSRYFANSTKRNKQISQVKASMKIKIPQNLTNEFQRLNRAWRTNSEEKNGRKRWKPTNSHNGRGKGKINFFTHFLPEADIKGAIIFQKAFTIIILPPRGCFKLNLFSST